MREVVESFQRMDDDDWRLNAKAFAAFTDMLGRLDRGARDLTTPQRTWIRAVHARLFETVSYENAWSAGTVPKGRDVPTPAVLQNLPKCPPGRKAP